MQKVTKEYFAFCIGLFFKLLATFAIVYPGVLIIAAGVQWRVFTASDAEQLDPGHLLAFAGCCVAYLVLLCLVAIVYRLYEPELV